ncbi:Conserved_hypothetical protein [Hexamita inflata]|uniref:Heme oxygenase n=1 Tax=Hexamita inflata TaxID=28002 RepID=A0AA86TWM6_9EUKA|nr:Conserved hypothetical protein [Hexamita inflata]
MKLQNLKQFEVNNKTELKPMSSSQLKISHPSIYDIIHKDALRGCWRFAQILENTKIDTRIIQCLFQEFFINTFSLHTAFISEYYQGLGTLFEMVMMHYLDLDKVAANFDKKLIHDENFEPCEQISQFFSQDYNFILSTSSNVMQKVLNETKCSNETLIDMSTKLYDVIKAKHINEYQLIKVERDMASISMLKYVIYCGLHIAPSYSLSILLADAYLAMDVTQQLDFIADVISLSIKAYKSNDKCCIIQEPFESHNDQFGDAMDMFTNAFKNVFVEENYNFVKEKLLQKENNSVLKWVVIGAVVFGVSAAVVKGLRK